LYDWQGYKLLYGFDGLYMQMAVPIEVIGTTTSGVCDGLCHNFCKGN